MRIENNRVISPSVSPTWNIPAARRNNTIMKFNDGEASYQGLYQSYTGFPDRPTGQFDKGDMVLVKETTGGTERIYTYDGSTWHYVALT
jgi:hypothetical protein